MQKQNKKTKEISLNVLYILLALLCLIWQLCYQSELKIPAVKDEQLLSRLESPNITIEKLTAHVERMYGRETIPFPHADNYPDKGQEINDKNTHQTQNNRGQLTNQISLSPCIILNHKIDNDYWLSSVLSIISQIQHIPSLQLYYINNFRAGKQIQSYLLSNDIHSSLVYFQSVDKQVNNFNFHSAIDVGREKCRRSSIVVVMDDDMILASEQILRIVQDRMRKDEGMIGYGGLTVIDKQRNKASLGQSYPYPSRIIAENGFKRYPLVVGGPVIISYSFLEKIVCKYCKNPNNGKFFSKIIKPAVLLQMLEKADSKIVYVDDVIAVMNEQNAEKFVTDLNVRQELKQIYKIW